MWLSRLDDASSILGQRHQGTAALVARTVRAVSPLPSSFGNRSASHTEGVGGVQASLPSRGIALAETLVHEARHSLLNAVLHLAPLTQRPGPDETEPRFYAPWRADPRPALPLLHGIYAFAGIAELWGEEWRASGDRGAHLAAFNFAVFRDSVAVAVHQLEHAGLLTGHGSHVIATIRAQLTAWMDEAIPPEPCALAMQDVLDSRATWRIRQRCPQDRIVDALAASFREGRAGPPAISYQPTLRARRHDRLPASRRRPEVIAADRALITGDRDAAYAGYLKVLAEHPGTRPAWVGLGLALEPDSPDEQIRAARRSLIDRPELVRHVHRTLLLSNDRSLDPITVAAWVDRKSC
jgi:hypothetical protein